MHYKPNRTALVHLLLTILTIIAGANYTILKVIVPSMMTPNAIVLFRISLGTIVFSLLARFYAPKTSRQLSKKDFYTIFLCAVFGVAGNQFFFYNGMKITAPINGSIFNLINPVTIIIMSYFILKEKVTLLTVAGLGMALAGALLLLDFDKFTITGSTFWGDLMVLINAIFFGTYVVLVTPLVQKHNPFIIAQWTFLFGLIIFFPFGITDLIDTDWTLFQHKHWYAFSYVMILTTLFAYFMNNQLPRMTSPYIIGIYMYFQPFIAALVAVIWGTDALTPQKIMCGILIIGGIYLSQLSRRKKLEQALQTDKS